MFGVVNTCAEDKNQPWANGEKKFVYHRPRSRGGHFGVEVTWEVKGRRKAIQNGGERPKKAKLCKRRHYRRVAVRSS